MATIFCIFKYHFQLGVSPEIQISHSRNNLLSLSKAQKNVLALYLPAWSRFPENHRMFKPSFESYIYWFNKKGAKTW